jgi:hypothetical protein
MQSTLHRSLVVFTVVLGTQIASAQGNLLGPGD